MAATIGPRDTKQKGSNALQDLLDLPVRANTKINQGSLVMIDAGYAAPAAAATGKIAAGRAQDTVDNTGGSAGDKRIQVRRGTFLFANKSGDVLAQADVGTDCYIEDDQTVRKTATGSSKAGRVIGVESAGVWVEIY